MKLRRPKGSLRCLVWLLLLNVLPATAAEEVLVLFSGNAQLGWQRSITDHLLGHMEQLIPLHPEKRETRVSIESLDVYRRGLVVDPVAFRNVLETKYRDVRFSKVLVEGRPAVELLKAMPEAFDEAAIFVFNNPQRSERWTTFQTSDYYQQSIAVAKQLDPQLERLVVVIDPMVAPLPLIREVWATHFSDQFVMDFIAAPFTFAELEQRVAAVTDEHTAILYTPVLCDATSVCRSIDHVAEDVFAAAQVPVYVMFEFLVGEGAAGGYVLSDQRIGEAMAEIVIAEKLSFESSFFFRHVFNQRQLDKLGLDNENLPESSVLINRELTLYQRYTEQLFAAAAILMALLIWVVVLRSQVRSRTAELESAVEAARAASQVKTDFLSNMSHEFRTPLNAVLAYSYMLTRPGNPSKVVEFASRIERAGHALLGLLNNLLDMAGSDIEDEAPASKTFRIGDLFEDVQVWIRAGADAKGLSLSVVNEVDETEPLIGDPQRIERVLMGLLDNAVKFTDHGSIQLRADALERGNDIHQVYVRFSVLDTGPGVAPGQRQRIFDAFTQADSSKTRVHGGAGVGLSIASRLVRSMGGELVLDQRYTRGAAFHFDLCFRTLTADTPFKSD